MAKLKAPLLSFGASGAIAKAVVYFPWKGLNVAREYVIPANPRTGPQTAQRGYLTDVVNAVHAFQAWPTTPLALKDNMAYALWASTEPTPRTWFNQVVKNWLNMKVLGKIPAIFGGCSITPDTDKLTVKLWQSPESDAITDGELWYGTSRTALIHKVAAAMADLATGVDIPNLTTGVKYFIQFRSTLPDTFDGNRSGIYYGVPL